MWRRWWCLCFLEGFLDVLMLPVWVCACLLPSRTIPMLYSLYYANVYLREVVLYKQSKHYMDGLKTAPWALLRLLGVVNFCVGLIDLIIVLPCMLFVCATLIRMPTMWKELKEFLDEEGERLALNLRSMDACAADNYKDFHDSISKANAHLKKEATECHEQRLAAYKAPKGVPFKWLQWCVHACCTLHRWRACTCLIECLIECSIECWKVLD